MKKTKFKIISGIFLLIIISLFLLLRSYNKPHKDIRTSKVYLALNAEYLLNEYLHDEDAANKKYVDNIIQIRGTVFKISALNGNSVITLKNGNSDTSIICQLIPEDNIKTLKLKKGEIITIKGVCSGFLIDVIMVRCIIIK